MDGAVTALVVVGVADTGAEETATAALFTRFRALSAVRLLLSAGVLAGAYFLAPLTPWDRTWMLVGAAAGLTLPMLLFTPRLLRQANGNPPDHDNTESTDRKGGE